MRIDIITVLPEMIEGFFNCSIMKRAQDKGLAEIHIHNLRDYTEDKYRRVDDYLRFQEHSTHNNYNYAGEVRHAIPLFFPLYPYLFDCLRQKYMFIFEYLYFCEKLKDYAY